MYQGQGAQSPRTRAMSPGQAMNEPSVEEKTAQMKAFYEKYNMPEKIKLIPNLVNQNKLPWHIMMEQMVRAIAVWSVPSSSIVFLFFLVH